MKTMDVYYALAEPRRRNILEILAENGKLTATEIFEKFDVSKPAISQHLSVLKKTNLVIVEKKAQQRIYQINVESLGEIEVWINKVAKLYGDRFDRLNKLLEEEKAKANIRLQIVENR